MSGMVVVVFTTLGVGGAAVAIRRAPRGSDALRSTWVAHWGGAAAWVLFCALCVVTGASGGNPSPWALLGLGVPMVVVAAAAAVGAAALRWWEPRADVRFRRRMGLPEGPPPRWQPSSAWWFWSAVATVMSVVVAGAVVVVAALLSAPGVGAYSRWGVLAVAVGSLCVGQVVGGLAALRQRRKIRRDTGRFG